MGEPKAMIVAFREDPDELELKVTIRGYSSFCVDQKGCSLHYGHLMQSYVRTNRGDLIQCRESCSCPKWTGHLMQSIVSKKGLMTAQSIYVSAFPVSNFVPCTIWYWYLSLPLKVNMYAVNDWLHRKRGWSLDVHQRPPCFHICVTLRHAEAAVYERFVRDLREAVREVARGVWPPMNTIKPNALTSGRGGEGEGKRAVGGRVGGGTVDEGLKKGEECGEGEGGGGWEEGSLSTYEHMESLGPGEVNTMLRSYLGAVLDGGEGVTQIQDKGDGGSGEGGGARDEFQQ
jgi:hypothetical protein